MKGTPLKPRNDLRDLGILLLAGMAVGYGMRYAASRAVARGPARMIDWNLASHYALRISQMSDIPLFNASARRELYLQLVERSEPLIAEYMGARLPHPIKKVMVVDRHGWLEANFISFERLFSPLEALYTDPARQRDLFGILFSHLNSRVVGVQMGVLLGWLAQRVLGQYDLSLLSPEPEAHGALYFVEPNIERIQRQLGVNEYEFRLWLTLHEVSHVFQFEAYPWVRPYFSGLLTQFFGQVSDQLNSLSAGLPELLQQLLNRAQGERHWIMSVLTDEQRRIFDQLQALMSLVEGYSNHLMNAIGGQLLPGFTIIEQRIKQRQQNRPLLEELFNRVTGMDLKLAQYQQGEAFVNAVVAARGIGFMNRVWERAEHLPTMEEIRNPQRWIARMEIAWA